MCWECPRGSVFLANGFEVRALVRKTSDLHHLKTTGAQIVFADVTDYEGLHAAADGVDIVFHAAAKVTPGWGTWEEFEKTTVRGTENLLKAAVEGEPAVFCRLAPTQSTATPASKATFRPTSSTECAVCLTPKTYYDYAKLLAERACWEYHRQGKIKVSMIRIGSAYGPRDRLISDRIYRYAASPIILWPGRGNPRYAIVNSYDIAELSIMAATSDKSIGEVYNVASPEPTRLKQFAEAMVRARGGRRVGEVSPSLVAYVWCYTMELVSTLRRAKQMPFLNRYFILQLNMECHLDGSKAKRELGWVPRMSLDEGTKQYVEWRRAEEEAEKKRKGKHPANT